MQNKINVQKDIALSLLKQLAFVDPFVMVAGGAVRDWELGFEAKDIDVYLRAPNHNTLRLRHDLLENIGLTNIQQLGKSKEDDFQLENYNHLPGLDAVFQGQYYGEIIQVMFMQFGIHQEITNKFDLDICDAYMKQNGQIVLVDEFEIAMSSQVSYLRPGYTLEHKHIKKMIERFPTISFVVPTEEQKSERLKHVISKIRGRYREDIPW